MSKVPHHQKEYVKDYMKHLKSNTKATYLHENDFRPLMSSFSSPYLCLPSQTDLILPGVRVELAYELNCSGFDIFTCVQHIPTTINQQ